MGSVPRNVAVSLTGYRLAMAEFLYRRSSSNQATFTQSYSHFVLWVGILLHFGQPQGAPLSLGRLATLTLVSGPRCLPSIPWLTHQVKTSGITRLNIWTYIRKEWDCLKDEFPKIWSPEETEPEVQTQATHPLHYLGVSMRWSRTQYFISGTVTCRMWGLGSTTLTTRFTHSNPSLLWLCGCKGRDWFVSTNIWHSRWQFSHCKLINYLSVCFLPLQHWGTMHPKDGSPMRHGLFSFCICKFRVMVSSTR